MTPFQQIEITITAQLAAPMLHPTMSPGQIADVVAIAVEAASQILLAYDALPDA